MTWYRAIHECIRITDDEDIRVAKDELERVHNIDGHDVKISQLIVMDSKDKEPIGIATHKLILQYLDQNPLNTGNKLIGRKRLSEATGQAYIPTSKVLLFSIEQSPGEIKNELKSLEMWSQFTEIGAVFLYKGAKDAIVGFATEYDIFFSPSDEEKKTK